MPRADEPRITLRLPRPLYEQLRVEAQGRGLSVSALARTKLVGADDEVAEDFERRLSRLEELAGL